MRRYGKIFASLALGMMVTLMAVDFAEARRASGGFGSRGTRTFSAPSATRTAPTTAAPIERTMTPRTNATQPGANQTAAQNAQRPGGMFGGLAGGLMGGLLLGGLFGMLMGSGFGGGFGFLGLLLQGVLIFFLIRFAMRMFANRQPSLSGGPKAGPDTGAAGGNPTGFGGLARNNQGPTSGSSFQIPRIGGGSVAQASAAKPGQTDEIGIGQKDLEYFETLLQQMQAGYAREDYSALRRITTPEAMSYLAEELSENATKGVKNEVRDVHLVQGDVSESWREGDVDYATVAMRYESIDYVVDRQSGKLINGDDQNPSESTEIWTFVRRPGADWQISAIQAVAQYE
ncbi:Tim44 domain-containing protein [Rhizobium sp. CECT 9324]|jgi:predicted lipid-binding transport protein (Tim44 family)|uniref:Tim44 domain-containing protein n=1 Tax=Rhizobium sp. CECT 9324 TaxID=2845820 RepID=UPI000DDEA649|nr:Tim44 domain-containing protein [Rhizobium sp. CECT 9324]CAH0341673.1 hypothetical protein RHI9324_03372 [Rhizobium sp. CECT 9324]